MTNNNTPTAPRWWYRSDAKRGVVIEEVKALAHGLYYEPYDQDDAFEYVRDDGKWLGPVPMPGELCGECHGTGSVTHGDSGPMECDACHGSGASMFCPHCGEVIA